MSGGPDKAKTNYKKNARRLRHRRLEVTVPDSEPGARKSIWTSTTRRWEHPSTAGSAVRENARFQSRSRPHSALRKREEGIQSGVASYDWETWAGAGKVELTANSLRIGLDILRKCLLLSLVLCRHGR